MSKKLLVVPAVLILMPMLAASQDLVDSVKLEVVKYNGLKDLILKQRGKVVYVDLWFLGCEPCRTGFPHLVDLHHKFRKDGLEIVTVNVNAQELPADENYKGSIEFLKSAKAGFRNVILDEDDKVWAKNLRISGFPSVYVFDRQGRWTQFNAPIKKEEVDRLVQKLLAEPAY